MHSAILIISLAVSTVISGVYRNKINSRNKSTNDNEMEKLSNFDVLMIPVLCSCGLYGLYLLLSVRNLSLNSFNFVSAADLQLFSILELKSSI